MPRRWIGLTVLATGLACLITASLAMRHEWRFHREATAIDAVVVGVSPSGIEYEFTPPGHALVHGAASTTATKGSSVLVYYLPTDPRQNRITTWFRNIGWICAGYLVGAVCVFLGAGALVVTRGAA
jgi:hypothetical protein